jgi:hypothetical protein
MRTYADWVVRHRLLVVSVTACVTLFLAQRISRLQVIVDPNTLNPPDHPYVVASKRVEQLFGTKRVVLIAITARTGDVFTASILGKVQRITAALLAAPDLTTGSVLSLAAPRAKSITARGDELVVHPLMARLPATPEELAGVKRAVAQNPLWRDLLVSADGRTASIVADFVIESGGVRAVVDRVRDIVDRERDASVDIALGGLTVFVAEIEAYSERMAFLFPLSLLITGLIHYEAFRTLQGLVLPLVTALIAVVWALGTMGLFAVPLDAFNSTTPILVLAVAAGHAVQVLKRYYEEYHRLAAAGLQAPRAASRTAVTNAMVGVGPVMLTAGGVAAASFFSLTVFRITTIRTFGIFTGLGILSAVALELTFIPALRALLPPPTLRERRREREERSWDRLTATIARWVLGRRTRIYVGTAALLAASCAGMARLVMDNSPRNFFAADSTVRRDDRTINERLNGTTTLYLVVEGAEPDAIKDPALLAQVEATQRFLAAHPAVGRTIAVTDFLKQMHRAMHADDPQFERLPDRRALIAQYLLLYSLSGGGGDLDAFVDGEYRATNVWTFLRTDSSAEVGALIGRVTQFTAGRFPGGSVRFGGAAPQSIALNDTLVHAKLLNLLQIAGVILLATAVVFRSLVAGVLVLVPLVLAVLANFGIMGWGGIPLNIPTSVISGMAIGIGADYAIYLFFRLREELRAQEDVEAAVRTTLATAGKATLFVASAITGGYAVLLLSWQFHIHLWFALLIGTAMVTSSLAALVVLTALLVSLRPRFLFSPAAGVAPGRASGLAASA